ncbi:MAG: hypothetical protein ACK45B_10405 [Limisphaerales bacterium]
MKLSSLLAAGLAVVVPAVAAVPPAEQLLPDDTLGFITVPDARKLRAAGGALPLLRLWQDDAVRPLRESFVAQLDERLRQPLEREFGVKLAALAELAQGQVTLALLGNGWNGEGSARPGGLLLVDTGSRAPEAEQALAAFRQQWADAGRTLRTERVRGVEFVVVTVTSNDVPASLKRLLPGPDDVRELGDDPDETPAPKTFWLGLSESLLLVGSERAALERLLARLGESAGGLGEQPEFRRIRDEFFRDAEVFGWFNTRAVMSTWQAASARREAAMAGAPDPFATIRPERLLGAVGLGGVRAAAFAFRAAPEGWLAQFHLAVPEAERQGVLRLFSVPPQETLPPPFVPADAVQFTRWRMEGPKTWATLTNAANAITPAIMSTVDWILNTAEEAGQAANPQFNLRRQLVDNLGDDLILFQRPSRGETEAELANPPELLLIGSPKPEEMAGALKVVLGALAGGPPPREREFLGRKIYTVSSMAGPQLDPTNPRYRALHVSANSSHVLVANEAGILEDVLRAAETPPAALRDAPGLAGALQQVTRPGTLFAGYRNRRAEQRAAFARWKVIAAGGRESTISGMTPVTESLGLSAPEESVLQWVDREKLPPFAAVEKYFHFTVFAGTATTDGLTFRVFAPTPPGLK